MEFNKFVNIVSELHNNKFIYPEQEIKSVKKGKLKMKELNYSE